MSTGRACTIVLGGNGFIGRSLVADLCANGTSVIAPTSAELDLVDRQATNNWFERITRTRDVTHVLHLAALYLAGGWPVAHPATQFRVNMNINVNVLEAVWRHMPNAKLVSILSYCMYPPGDQAHPEEELWGTEPEAYLFAYAETKKVLLIGMRAYLQEHGLKSVAVVLPTVYGPGDSFAEDSHVMGALIGKFIRAQRAGDSEVEVWGDGTQEREFLYVSDAVSGIMTAAAGPSWTAEAFNLGGSVCSIAELARMIAAETGYAGAIRYNEDRFVGVKKRALNDRKVRDALGWTRRVALQEGIARTVPAYLAQLDREH